MEEYYKIVAYILAGLLGICVGSFLNVVIYRIPNGMRLDKPDSHCPKCQYKLRWYDNVPVLSYIALGGRCRKCKEKISFRYPAVELANMLMWLASVWMFWDQSPYFAGIHALASSLLICVFFIDLDHMLVFDRFVIMLAVLGVVSIFFDPSYGWLSHVIGGVAGFVFFYAIHALFYYGFKKDALGGGDIKLTGAVGLLLGWERLLLAIVLASVVASVVLVILSRRKQKTEQGEENAGEYPFAPFLCAGFWIALTFGAQIISAYLGLLGL